MSVIRVGSTSTYAEGWDAIFGGRRVTTKRSATAASRPAARKAAKKKASRTAKKKAVTKARKPGKSRRG